MMKVMVVEDEEHIRGILQKMIERNDGFTVVSSCGDFASAISDFIRLRPEVVFMDIDLNGESGMECAKAITEVEPKVKIVFATAHSEYMANAFEIYAFDYLVKPFDMERIAKTLGRIADTAGQEEKTGRPEKTDDEKLIIRGKEEINFVDIKDIIMIERVDSMTRIITKDETYLTAQSLSSLEEKLNAEKFMRCHKSYIISIDAIKKLEVYGRWTYIVRFKGTDETALMTSAKYDEIKKRY
ncbi:MAG: LytTR family DNA-binding domain-containing protein [Lachnospiraceae bacterium]|nr:response regulator transcription factor [Lachnospiraceae bacterium]MCR5768997.1 LytTR family DNA-binding domain-containing protein [Lachnospiraceae bacterium]